MVSSLQTQHLPPVSGSSVPHSLVVADCEAVISTRAYRHPEPGALACLDLPQPAGPSGRKAFAQVFAFVKDFRWERLSTEQLKKRVVERSAGLQLPQDLTFYQGVRYTLLLRHRDTLDGVDLSRPIKLRSVSYIHSQLRMLPVKILTRSLTFSGRYVSVCNVPEYHIIWMRRMVLFGRSFRRCAIA